MEIVAFDLQFSLFIWATITRMTWYVSLALALQGINIQIAISMLQFFVTFLLLSVAIICVDVMRRVA